MCYDICANIKRDVFFVELIQLANIIQGNIPTRIEVSVGKTLETITIQELNYIANVSDDFPVAKYLTVQSEKADSYVFTQSGDVLVGLSTGKAIVIEPIKAEKLVLSNMAIVRIKNVNQIDPYYLCWYINENKAALKELNKLKQATAATSIIPLSMLKNFEIVLLPIEKQRIIGKIYELKRQRDRITHSIETKKTELLSHQLVKIFEKESNNGNK